MDWKQETRLRLCEVFQGGFFNHLDEFISHRYSNTYFIFRTCESLEEVNCKILEWFSRPASKGQPYQAEWRNKKFRQFMLAGINTFLNTNFNEDDIALIYQELGNAIRHQKTIEFVRSGYDMELLKRGDRYGKD